MAVSVLDASGALAYLSFPGSAFLVNAISWISFAFISFHHLRYPAMDLENVSGSFGPNARCADSRCPRRDSYKDHGGDGDNNSD
ncbi:hypothetical protein Trco_000674 [Trichoderma cornu-damae]|uniref:Uncharacterized protein n=1 Tax=Trichoderma cornu-damae TaxID=654480 RepID=A0A9P8TZ85_9HYPO|nr:hypothetical protein Trco_000674 [Trichoderma cornu-damae]